MTEPNRHGIIEQVKLTEAGPKIIVNRYENGDVIITIFHDGQAYGITRADLPNSGGQTGVKLSPRS
jgi:hypothetical protein